MPRHAPDRVEPAPGPPPVPGSDSNPSPTPVPRQPSTRSVWRFTAIPGRDRRPDRQHPDSWGAGPPGRRGPKPMPERAREVVSGHRRLACARPWVWSRSPARSGPSPHGRAPRAVLEYNRQRRKTFSQMIREADGARGPGGGRRATTPPGQPPPVPAAGAEEDQTGPCRKSDSDGWRVGPTPPIARSHRASAARTSIARPAIWQVAQAGDPRAQRAWPARRRDQDDPRRPQGPAPPRPLQRGLSPDPLRRLAVPPRSRLRHPPSRARSRLRSSPTRSLLYPPRRPGGRPDGGRRHDTRRLRHDGTSLPGV